MYLSKRIGTHKGQSVIVRKRNKDGGLGVVLCWASSEKQEKYSPVPCSKGKSVDDIDLEYALEILSFPKVIGQIEGRDIVVGTSTDGFLLLLSNEIKNIPKAIKLDGIMDWARLYLSSRKKISLPLHNIKTKHAQKTKVRIHRGSAKGVQSYIARFFLDKINSDEAALSEASEALLISKEEIMAVLNKSVQ